MMLASIRSPVGVYSHSRQGAQPRSRSRSLCANRSRAARPTMIRAANKYVESPPTKVVSSSLGVTLPAAAAAAAATAVAAVAMETTAVDMDTLTTVAASTAYVPSPLPDDGMAQLVVVLVCAVCGMAGMLTSFQGEQSASEEALAEKVAAQVAAMRTATSEPVVGIPAERVASDPNAAYSTFDDRGLLRVDAALSPGTAAELLAEVNATLDRELSRAGRGGGGGGGGGLASLPSDSFGNVYCKGNRYDLKLPLEGAAAKALKEAVGRMRPFLELAAGGRRARLCEFAALVSDPGSARQPVHPDTNYRRGRCVVTSFVALQEVAADMGPTVFIPGSHTASAHLAFRDAGERGGAALEAPNGVATLGTGDATVFDSRLLHCGGGNGSDKRRVLFYFSFEVDGSDNPNAAVSSIRNELRGAYTLADL